MCRALAVSLGLSFILCSLSFAQAKPKETIVIETYYPSPYGVYQRLTMYPNTDFFPGTGCTLEPEGEMYYDSLTYTLYICSGGITRKWIPAPGL